MIAKLTDLEKMEWKVQYTLNKNSKRRKKRTERGNTLRHNESDSFRTDETWYFSDSRITMSLKPMKWNLYLDISHKDTVRYKTQALFIIIAAEGHWQKGRNPFQYDIR